MLHTCLSSRRYLCSCNHQYLYFIFQQSRQVFPLQITTHSAREDCTVVSVLPCHGRSNRHASNNPFCSNNLRGSMVELKMTMTLAAPPAHVATDTFALACHVLLLPVGFMCFIVVKMNSHCSSYTVLYVFMCGSSPGASLALYSYSTAVRMTVCGYRFEVLRCKSQYRVLCGTSAA